MNKIEKKDEKKNTAWNKVPEDIKKVTEALADNYPPTNPAVILRAANYWYFNGDNNNPFYRQAISWLHECAGIQNDLDVFEEFINELKKVKGDTDDC
jgi:spore germination protein GerM